MRTPNFGGDALKDELHNDLSGIAVVRFVLGQFFENGPYGEHVYNVCQNVRDTFEHAAAIDYYSYDTYDS